MVDWRCQLLMFNVIYFSQNSILSYPLYPQVLSPTYKQRNEEFRRLFKKLPDTERLIVGELII